MSTRLNQELRNLLSELGRKGGAARWANMTSEQRSKHGRRMVRARWANYQRKLKEVARTK